MCMKVIEGWSPFFMETGQSKRVLQVLKKTALLNMFFREEGVIIVL